MTDDRHALNPAATRAPKSQMLRTVEAIAHAKADRQAGRVDHRRQADHRAAGHDHPEAATAAGHPHPHALLPRGLVPGRRVPHLRGRGRRAADAAGGVQLPDHRPDPGPHPHAARSAAPGGTSSTCCWPATTATATPACATTTASCRRWPRSTASISSASATSRRRATQIDRSSYAVVRDMNKCVLCRRCIRTCIDLQEVGVLEAIDRGNRTNVSTFMDKPLADVICINCGQCINRCPTGALQANDTTDEVWAAIDDPEQARGHPDRAQPAGGHRRVFRPAAGPRPDLRAEHRPARLRLRQGVRHQLRRRPDDPRGRDRAAAAAAPRPGRRRPARRPCRSSPVARPAGSSTSSTSIPSTWPTSPRPRARSRCSARC